MQNKLLNIVLVAPEIPGNTGSLGRTSLALNSRLILIEPLGFDLSEKSVRRAGLDYWSEVDCTLYKNFDEFLDQESPTQSQLKLFSKKAKNIVYQANFNEGDYLIFGCESAGLPEEILTQYKEYLFRLPQLSESIRSLNLASAATTICYEALRQIRYS